MARRDRWLEHYILNEKGSPIIVDLMTWAKWFEKKDRLIKQEWVGDCWVSTVFLGIDHNFSNKGPPILWETMVFTNYKNVDQEWMDRCAGSLEQALAMHEAMIRKVCEFQNIDYAEFRKETNGNNIPTT